MKKKIVIATIMLTLAMGSVACGESKNDESSTTGHEPESKQETTLGSANETVEKSATDENVVLQQVAINAVPTLKGDVCVFIQNNSDTVIDELDAQILYKDESGNTIDVASDGHDMILPGSTVVSRMEAPDSYNKIETAASIELGVNRGYENHAADVDVNANKGDSGLIIEIKNNSDVDIDEIEYIAVFYQGDDIAKVGFSSDVRDVKAGATVIEKESTYDLEYDRFEVYLNQAHTFGL